MPNFHGIENRREKPGRDGKTLINSDHRDGGNVETGGICNLAR